MEFETTERERKKHRNEINISNAKDRWQPKSVIDFVNDGKNTFQLTMV